jgi:prepilin-type N-terminal cleavage/methylation domain-containing protein
MSSVTVVVAKQRRRSAQGFTLIELVIVVGILALLAGLVLPNLGDFKLRANKAVSATDMADLSRSIQQFYGQYAAFPDKWDSLLDGSGKLWTATLDANGNLTPGLDSELPGGPIPGSPHKLITETIVSDGEMRSISRMGLRTVLDVGTGSVTDLPTDWFSVPRTLATGGTVATVNPSDPDGQMIINHIYPQQANLAAPVVPAGKHLVVVGVGPLNTMVGTSLQEIPLYPNRDPSKEYCRFLAVFEASEDGSPANLKLCLGADGDTIGSETAEYYQH